MHVVVSDTSPIRALHHLGLLPLLGKLFSQIIIPPAVQNELNSPPPQLQVVDLSNFDFVKIRAPQDTAHVEQLFGVLDIGEAEALVVALESNAQAMLVDELAGRREAARCGLEAIGTLGILLRGKANGHLLEIRPLIDRLMDETGFFVSLTLKSGVLKLAGE